MLYSLQVFLITIALFGVFKECESSCIKVGDRVTCESVRYISSAVFSKIPDIQKVTQVIISSNPELEISPKAFEPVTKLRLLIFNNNKINKIYYDSFQNIPTIEALILGSNNIDTLFPGMFSSLSSLQILKLNDNNLSEVPMGLANLPLKEVKLSNNNIRAIENKELENLPFLTKLQIDGNKLETIFVHRILTYPQKLGLLNLQNNYLTIITNYMLQELNNLLFLNLGHNLISFIEPNSFEQTPNLNYLTLSHNHLKQISENVLPRTGMPYLKVLNLDSNKLMYLPNGFFARLGSLKEISITGNPWFCPCLFVLEKLLKEGNIKEVCVEDYISGKRPICVNDEANDTKCEYIYNDRLSERYVTYKINDPLEKPPLSCVVIK